MSNEGPLFATEAAALQAEGELYRHFKGGIYRLVMRDVLYSDDSLRPHVVYEHLYPHAHRFWVRAQEDFFAALPSGEPRFALIKKR